MRGCVLGARLRRPGRAQSGGGWVAVEEGLSSEHPQPALFGRLAVGETCHSAAPPSPFSRRFNMDGEGMPVK